MFKGKKKPDISTPSNFEHRVKVHVDGDQYQGLPPQWGSLINADGPRQRPQGVYHQQQNMHQMPGQMPPMSQAQQLNQGQYQFKNGIGGPAHMNGGGQHGNQLNTNGAQFSHHLSNGNNYSNDRSQHNLTNQPPHAFLANNQNFPGAGKQFVPNPNELAARMNSMHINDQRQMGGVMKKPPLQNVPQQFDTQTMPLQNNGKANFGPPGHQPQFNTLSGGQPPMQNPMKQPESPSTTSTTVPGSPGGPPSTPMPSYQPLPQNILEDPDQFLSALKDVVFPDDPSTIFEDLGFLAEGSTARVVVANEKPTGKRVAIKKMPIATQARRDLLFNEVAVLRDSKHPNIVDLFGSFIMPRTTPPGGELWLVMEFLEGGQFTDVVTACQMTARQIATVSVGVLNALHFLHSRGVLHRDVKSDSILLGVDGRIKLSDFGFCARVTPSLPRRNSFVGTPYWMSPQVIACQPYASDTDIWSFGMLCIEMIDGEPAYFSMQPTMAMRQIRDQSPPKPRTDIHTHEFQQMPDFLSRCLVKDPTQRATAASLLQHSFLSQADAPACLVPLIHATRQQKQQQQQPPPMGQQPPY